MPNTWPEIGDLQRRFGYTLSYWQCVIAERLEKELCTAAEIRRVLPSGPSPTDRSEHANKTG